ncbi:MAG: GTPase Era [Lachnospiraceae bacterium]|nr:GTPase Era [Lachnospiraceae bacterium]
MALNGLVKSGFVSILGLPNAGKSSFLNAVINDNIAITSKKPQTTRKNLKGIYNDEEAQIVFVDTPGIHDVKNKLDDYMSKSISKSIDDIDLIVVIVDIMTYETDKYDKIVKKISKSKAKKVLIVNKCDLVEYDEGQVLNAINEKFGKDIVFEKVFFISALKNKNIKTVIEYIKNELPEGSRYYSEDDLTDEPMKQIVADMIRQQCLYKLDKEIPHGIAVIVNSMKKSKTKCMNIDATIICERDSHKGIIIGKSGSMIKNIGTGSRISIEKFIDSKVNLKLDVIVKNNWRDEKTLLANYGYDGKEL